MKSTTDLARSLAWLALIALPAHAALAASQPLDQLDALQASPVTDAGETERGFARRAATHNGHFERRLDLPTFIAASTTAPVLFDAASVSGDPANVARGYLKNLRDTYRLTTAEIDGLTVKGIQRLNGSAVIVQFDQAVGDIDIFRDHASVLVNADGSLNSIGGYVSGTQNIAGRPLADLFKRTPVQAISRALEDFDLAEKNIATALTVDSKEGDFTLFQLPSEPRLVAPIRVKPVYFRLPSGLVPAHYVEVQIERVVDDHSTMAYSYVVSAKDGEVLFRNNLIDDATAFSYRAWAENQPPFLPYPGPQGRNASPHPTAQPDGYQAPFVAQNLVTLVNAIQDPESLAINDPWLPDDAKYTLGNNVDAYADIAGADGYQPDDGDLRPDLTAATTFDRTHDPLVDPQASEQQIKASTTQLFYTVNWLHDAFYDAGFDEAAGNAQADNYGRGGEGLDAIRAEAQDSSGTDNANMFTPADGASPVMQMYVFSGVGAQHVAIPLAVPPLDTSEVGTADWGPQNFVITQTAVLADDGQGTPSDGCETPFANAAAVSGAIAVVDRGSCTFELKALNAAAAGAIGMIVINNQAGTINMGGSNLGSTLPSVSVLQSDGPAIKAGLLNGPVSATIERSAGLRRDGTLDNGIVAHEWGHYISNRLIGNANGLTTNQSGGMGEGWGDFHALMMIVKEEDAQAPSNPNFAGTYAAAAYATAGTAPNVINNNYYVGLRRYPYSTNFDKNPLTYKHIQTDVPLPEKPVPAFILDNAEVHNTGEVWASMLWECYASLLRDSQRLTFDEAQDRMKRYLVGGYKMTPVAPTFVEARDALLSVIKAEDVTDFHLCAGGFARRGLGAGAKGPDDRFGVDNSGIVESFATGAAGELSTAELSDEPGSCDVDGVLDNSEVGTLSVKVRNTGFQSMAATTIAFSSADPTIVVPTEPVDLATIQPSETKTIDIPVALEGADGISLIDIQYTVDDPSLDAPVIGQAQFRVNTDVSAEASVDEDFETPLKWTPVTEGFSDSQYEWRQRELGADQHVAFGPDAGFPGLNMLLSPPMQISAEENFSIDFEMRYAFESSDQDYDGGVIELTQDGGQTWVDVTTLATISPAYSGTIFDDPSNPYGGRAAYVGSSAGFSDGVHIPVNLDFGDSLQGQTIQLRFVIASDVAIGAFGWSIDSLSANGLINTPFDVLVGDAGQCALNDVIFEDDFEPVQP